MSAQSLRPLLEHRLVIVTGKGGTGKTTTSAALSLAAQKAGLRVALAEVGLGEQAPRLLVKNAPTVGYEGAELLPGLRVLHIDPFDALIDYLGLQLGVKAPVQLVFKNHAFRQFLDAAPGWRELITLGKVWHLEQLTTDSGRPLYDLIVVDAPATGHGLTFLDVPRVVGSAVRSGPLRRNAEAVEALIRDHGKTLLLPVSLGEELPARESAELATRVRDEIGVAVDRIVVNAVAPVPFPPELSDLDERLAQVVADGGSVPYAKPFAACASMLASRHALNAGYVEQIARDTQLPVLPLPYLDGGIRSPGDLAVLADQLVAEPAEPARLPIASEVAEARRRSEAA